MYKYRKHRKAHSNKAAKSKQMKKDVEQIVILSNRLKTIKQIKKSQNAKKTTKRKQH